MNDKTPKRIQSNNDFSPITLRQSPASPSFQGLQKQLAYDMSKKCNDNVKIWNEIHMKGSFFVKEIAALKAENPKNFEAPLESLMENLYSIVNQLEQLKNQFSITVIQAKAMADVQKLEEPLFISLNASQFAKLINELGAAYESALQDAKLVQDNIAHSKSKEEAVFYAAMWTYQCKISDNANLKLETLLIESGQRKIRDR